MLDAASELARLRAELAATKADLARSEAVVSASEAIISGLKLEIARLKRDKYGRSAERAARLIDQLELQLEELESAASEEAIQAEKTTKVTSFERRKPVRKAFSEHLSRERVVVEAPTTCSCCGSSQIVKMGEDITETLEAQHSLVCMLRHGSGRWSRRSGRSSPAGTVRRSASRRRRSIRRPKDGRGRTCWR